MVLVAASVLLPRTVSASPSGVRSRSATVSVWASATCTPVYRRSQTTMRW